MDAWMIVELTQHRRPMAGPPEDSLFPILFMVLFILLIGALDYFTRKSPAKHH
jgi:hypothetical protein